MLAGVPKWLRGEVKVSLSTASLEVIKGHVAVFRVIRADEEAEEFTMSGVEFDRIESTTTAEEVADDGDLDGSVFGCSHCRESL